MAGNDCVIGLAVFFLQEKKQELITIKIATSTCFLFFLIKPMLHFVPKHIWYVVTNLFNDNRVAVKSCCDGITCFKIYII